MHFISEKDVYDVKPSELRQMVKRSEMEIQFLNKKNEIIKRGTVGFSDLLINSDKFRDSIYDAAFFAIRSIGHLNLESRPDGGYYHLLTLDNFSEVAEGISYKEEELDILIMQMTLRFFNNFPERMLMMHDLLLSIFSDPIQVFNRVSYWGRRGYLGRMTGQQAFGINDQSLVKMEDYLTSKSDMKNIGSGYFKEVQLTQIHDKPYIFVLMPFKEEDFPQRVYHEVIQPTIRNEIKLKCLRADEGQNANLITDQIYSQIKRANIIIAEITNLNSNVLIEIGVALSLGKQVYMFHNENDLPKDKIPFYLSKVPYRSYTNDIELINELKKIEKEPLA